MKEAICSVGEHKIGIELQEAWTTVRFADGEIFNKLRYIIKTFSVNDSPRFHLCDILYKIFGSEGSVFYITVKDGSKSKKIPILVTKRCADKDGIGILETEDDDDSKFKDHIFEAVIDMIEGYALKNGILSDSTERL